MMRRALRRRRTSAGFTVVELAITMVIMGLVFTPLCMALVQTITTIPQAAQETQHSTDVARLQSAMVDAITQAQGIDVYIGFGSGWNSIQLHTFAENSPTSWTTNDYNASLLSPLPFKCQTQAAPWNLFDAWRSTAGGVDASGNVPQYGSASVTAELYTMTVTSFSGTWNKVVVHRWVSTGNAPVNPAMSSPGTYTDSDPNGYLTGYCNSAGPETIATLTTGTPNEGGRVQATLGVSIMLHPRVGSAQSYATNILAAARASGSN